jgi:hypothetical protein
LSKVFFSLSSPSLAMDIEQIRAVEANSGFSSPGTQEAPCKGDIRAEVQIISVLSVPLHPG